MKYIECLNIGKKFGNNVVLNSFNAKFTNENINFITGSNGTGKSTLISCMLEFLRFDGTIRNNVKKIVYQPEKVVLPDYIKVLDYLQMISQLHKQYDIEKIKELITIFDLTQIINKDLIHLSKGMRQKVLIIQTLMIEADCYIFDEPLGGLDPLMQETFIKELKKLFQKEKLIIIVTHFLEQYRLDNKKIIDLNHQEQYSYD